jgi:hypothetical protein
MPCVTSNGWKYDIDKPLPENTSRTTTQRDLGHIQKDIE